MPFQKMTESLQPVRDYRAFNILLMLFGSATNLWFVTCILTSRDLRHRLRTQLICNLSLSSLLVTLVRAPVVVASLTYFLDGSLGSGTWDTLCHLDTAEEASDFIQSGLVDWLLVILVAVFVASILDFDLSVKLTPRSLRICKIALHLIPWLVIIITTPLSITAAEDESGCSNINSDHYPIYVIFYTIVPIGICIFLLAVSGVLICWRSGIRQGAVPASGNSRHQPVVRRASMRDPPYAYMLAVAVAAGCEICQIIFFFDRMEFDPTG